MCRELETAPSGGAGVPPANRNLKQAGHFHRGQDARATLAAGTSNEGDLRRRRRRLIGLTAVIVVATLCFVPWLAVVYSTFRDYAATGAASPSVGMWLSATAAAWLPGPPLLRWACVAGVFAAPLVHRDRHQLAIWLFTLSLVVLPALLFSWSSSGHFLAPRYLIAALPFVLLQLAAVLAAPLEWSIHSGNRPAAGLSAAVLIVAVGVLMFANYRVHDTTRAGHKQDWKSVSAYLKRQVRPRDLIVPGIDLTHLCLEYYLPPELKPQLTPNRSGNARNLPVAARSGRPVWYVAPDYTLRHSPAIATWLKSYFTELQIIPGTSSRIHIFHGPKER